MIIKLQSFLDWKCSCPIPDGDVLCRTCAPGAHAAPVGKTLERNTALIPNPKVDARCAPSSVMTSELPIGFLLEVDTHVPQLFSRKS